jgi:hypothetical protein
VGTGQGPIKIQSGNQLDVGETTSNVATNKAELAALAANIDGKDTYPQSVSTQRLQVAQTLSIGDQVQLTDGCVKSNHLTTDSAVITNSLQIGNNVITEDAINVPNLSSLNANLGTITGGSLSIGSGGVTVSGGEGGVYIGDNQIFLGTAGSPTVLLDGSTGIIYASKFQMTADEDSTLDMSLGSLTIGGGTSVDGTTTIGDIASDASQAASDASAALGAAAAALEVADGEIVGYYQTTEPTSGMKFGDIWIDTNYAGFPTTSAIFRYQDVDGGSTGALAWRSAPNNAIGKVYLNAYSASVSAGTAQSTADSKITTFYQTSAPTALATGDLWVDTDAGNKLYRWSGSNWVSIRDSGAAAGATALQEGDALSSSQDYMTVVDGQVTDIDTNGISIGTATSGARVQINSTGVGVYNSSGTLKTWMDINGFHCQRGSSSIPKTMERVSFNNSGGTETGFVSSGSDGLLVAGYDGPLFLQAGLYPSGSNWTWYDHVMELYAGSSITLMPGMNGSGSDTVYVGNASHTGKKLAVYGNIEFNDDDGTKPTISSGSGTPSSTPAYGSLYLSSGGSLWLYTASGWSRIYAADTAAATAHPS